MIYFIRAGEAGAIKIGYTKSDANRRLYELQTSHPEPLRILGIMGGDCEAERSLHRRFAKDHLRGEWFNPSPELLNFIESNTVREAAQKRFERRLSWQMDDRRERAAAWEAGAPRYSRYGYGGRRFTSRSPRT
jgi:hypothetical protein